MLTDDRPRRSRRIQLHRVEDGCVVYVPATDDVHFLNQTAMSVLDLCDGTRTVASLQADFGAPSEVEFDLSAGILAQFAHAGLICHRDGPRGRMSDRSAPTVSSEVRFGLGPLQVVLAGFPDDQHDLLSHLVNLADDVEPTRGSLSLRLSRTADRGREIFEDDSSAAKATCCDEVSLAYMLHRMTTRQLALYDDWACLHCGAATLGGALVLFTGDRGAGKTTLLLQLLRNGAAFHCDEYVVVRDGIAATIPRRLHVKPGTLDCLPTVADACADKPLLMLGSGPRFYPLDPSELGYAWKSAAGRPAAIFHLTADFGRPPVAEPIAQIEMVKRLMYQAISGHRQPGELAKHVCSIVDGVPCFELRVGPLAETASLVQRTIEICQV